VVSRPAGPARDRSWPFTGRDAELRAVATALERDGAVVVAGAAGVGKSRLARELVARLVPEEKVAVATATASSREIPLGAFAPWLPETGSGVSALARVAAELRASRALLLVDDAHVLDDASATLVHQLALEGGLSLVLTVRTGDPCPEAVTAIWKDGLAERVEVGPLGPDACAALLGAALDGPVEAQSQRRLHDATRGNVLWLRHLVEGERAGRRLVTVGGHWEWHGAPALSPALEQLLLERIGDLDAGERHVLEVLALGEPLGLGLLAVLAADAAVERVAERGLITVVADGVRSEVHLAHPLYGEVTRAALSVPRERRLRGELARALRATGGRRAGDDLRLAVLDLGSDRPPDAELLLLAAEQALHRTDFGLAERLLRAAVAAGGGFDARLGLGFLLAWMMRVDEAEGELAEAFAAAVDASQRARAVLARAHLLIFLLGRGDEARELLDRDGRDASGRPHPEVAALHAALLVAHGRVGDGLRAGRELLDRPYTPQVTTWASWAASYALAYGGGSAAELQETVERGMAAALHAPETATMLGNIGFAEILGAGLSGRLDDARGRVGWIESLPGEHGATWSALYRGRLALEAGRPATAAHLLTSILSTFPGHGGGWTAWLHALIARAQALTGDPDAAEASIRTAREVQHPEIRLSVGDTELADAWLAAARGSLPDAVSIARRVADVAAAGERLAEELLARHTAVRLGDRDQHPRLAELARVLPTPRAAGASAHAAGLAARDPDALLAAADTFEACGLVLDAADAAAHAAVVAREVGRLDAGTAAADRARDLAERCEGAATPALARAHAPVPVSSREREVATLAAEGLTNRQIAARLHVSVRTVESHIYRACTRLGLPDRAALVAAVVPARRG
jgi:DNA-binding NarL/FixJ family response regulator